VNCLRNTVVRAAAAALVALALLLCLVGSGDLPSSRSNISTISHVVTLQRPAADEGRRNSPKSSRQFALFAAVKTVSNPFLQDSRRTTLTREAGARILQAGAMLPDRSPPTIF